MTYLPQNIEQLITWATVFFVCLKANIGTWGVNEVWVTEVETKFTDMQEAHTIWVNPATKTKAAHTDMEAKRTLFVKAVEPLVQNLKTLPMLTPMDYDLLGIPAPSSGHHPKYPTPTRWPELTLEVHGQGTVDVHYHDVETPSSTAKPHGVQEAVIRLGFLDHEPASADELTEKPVTMTRTPHRIVFSSEYSGKKLYAAGAWLNPTGERGPWGPIVKVVVS
ncbi:MAG: hypothetical protein LBT76_07015 [Tannerella sp.]|jgi:hypothetical protein|nr:hypothetical protein [Tannerella sp.]